MSKSLIRCKWIALSFFFIAINAFSQVDVSGNWLTVNEKSLVVKDGSALDFSFLASAGRAGKDGWAVVLDDGHIGFEKNKIGNRFLIASLTFANAAGGVPNHFQSSVLAKQFRLTGYNAVRLHYVDAQLMTGRDRDFDFNPVDLDNFHYLLSQLAENGIYWIVDGMTSDNGGWGGVRPHPWVKKHRSKISVYLSDEGFHHWQLLIEKLWGRVNPYTGIPPLLDPAMLGIILVNEGGLNYLSSIDGGVYPDALKPRFQEWLKSRYGDDSKLRAAWGKDFRGDESLGGWVNLPSIRDQSMRGRDFAGFVIDLEKDAYSKMQETVRSLGFRGLVTGFNNWSFFSSDLTRGNLQWVDMHSYMSLPSKHGQPGSVLEQTSVFDNDAEYIRLLASSRHWGKPFSVTEYGQLFWNRWRHESAVLVPAVAALQNWDAISQFAEVPFLESYSGQTAVRKTAIFPYGVGADPVARAGERLGALLFRRGDVSTSRRRVHMQLSASNIAAVNGGWQQMPDMLSELALSTGVGLEVDVEDLRSSIANVVGDDISLPVPILGNGILDKIKEKTGKTSGFDKDSLTVLRRENLLSTAQAGEFVSDTGELEFSSARRIISIDSARSSVIVFRAGRGGRNKALNILDPSASALVALTSIDSRPISSSERLLLWVVTDALNSNMTFKSSDRRELVRLGSFPPKIEPFKSVISMKIAKNKDFKIWALSLAGERVELLNGSILNGNLTFDLDTSKLLNGPSLYFEIEAGK